MIRRLLYFAYGSNLHPVRLRTRAPTYRVIGSAELAGHRLHFHKSGVDGSGKCNIVRTGNGAHRVMGVVYDIDVAEKVVLDAAEGRGYRAVTVEVRVAEQLQRVFCYQAAAGFIDNSLRPYSWYKEFVVRGAAAHGLPREYLRELEAVEAIEDPCQHRAKRHLRLILYED